MKTRTPFIKRNLQVAAVLISVVYFSSLAFAIEPIGTIGSPNRSRQT